MKKEQRFNRKTKFKKNQMLRDRHDHAYGKVVEVLKTRIKVNFGGQILTYDWDHYQFLQNA